MEAFLDFYYSIPTSVFTAFSVIERVACVLMIFFSSKYRSGFPKAGWYIFALFFPTLAGVVFIIKRKEMGAPDMKACPVCKSKYPKDFTYCHKCNIELDEYNPKKKQAQKVFALLFAVLFIASTLTTTIIDAGVLIDEIFSGEELDGEEPGIAVDGVYYDRNGNSYLSFYEVPLYTKDGECFIYSNATERYESKSDSLAVHECVIDKNGYVAEKAADELEYFPDESDDFEHYEDKDKNRYYPVTLIGWNEKGQVLLRSSYDALDYELLEEKG